MSNQPRKELNDDHKLTTLCLRITNHDHDAEQELVQHFLPYIVTIVGRKISVQYQADIVQEVLLQLLIKLRASEIREPSALKYYIGSIVAHIIAKTFGFLQAAQLVSFEDVEMESHSESAFDNIAANDKKIALLSAIEGLPQPRDQQLLKALLFSNQEKTSICLQWDIEPTQYDRIVHRAKNRLIKAIKR